MQIQTALDWNQVSLDLKRQLSTIGYNPDLQKMFKNIDSMVTDLSKLEVSSRRYQKTNLTVDKVAKINTAINHLEKLILMAKLMS